jgi:hypothetical protein
VRVPVGSPVVAGQCEAGRSGRAGVVAPGYNRQCYLALNHARPAEELTTEGTERHGGSERIGIRSKSKIKSKIMTKTKTRTKTRTRTRIRLGGGGESGGSADGGRGDQVGDPAVLSLAFARGDLTAGGET